MSENPDIDFVALHAEFLAAQAESAAAAERFLAAQQLPTLALDEGAAVRPYREGVNLKFEVQVSRNGPTEIVNLTPARLVRLADLVESTNLRALVAAGDGGGVQPPPPIRTPPGGG